MKSSYKPEDVTILLKDITAQVKPMENVERERYIQSGVHYCEMLPKEHLPSTAYIRTFYQVLERYALPTAHAVAVVGEKIYADKGDDTVLVSLARAGTPVGILIKRYLEKKYQISIPHYTISIIRGRGIDQNAMAYLILHHAKETIQFVDGWTGKGAIQHQLREAMRDYPGVDDTVAVLSDPAFVAGKCGTHCDFLIPSSCLNATVSGLLSRTFLRSDIISPEDFHGACYYQEFEKEDLTNFFLDRVERELRCNFIFEEPEYSPDEMPLDEVHQIAEDYDIQNIHFIKPGIGETTRVLLRRVPWKILVHSLSDTEHLCHIYQLATEKGIPLEVYPLRYYKACGLIQNLGG